MPKSSEYGPEAWRRFSALAEVGRPIMLVVWCLCSVQGRKLVANIDQREGNLLHLRLIDPSDPNAADDPLACLNADLVREGLATVDKSLRYISSYPQIMKKLEAGEFRFLVKIRPRLILPATEGAKMDRLGIFE